MTETDANGFPRFYDANGNEMCYKCGKPVKPHREDPKKRVHVEEQIDAHHSPNR